MQITRENPARTHEVVGSIASATPEVVDRVVRAAARTQPEWAGRSLSDRARSLLTAADAVEPEVEAIAELVARETGKVLPDALGEVRFALAVLRHSADRAPEVLAPVTTDDERGRLTVRQRPFGVVAAVTPWNAPIILTMLKVAPALVAGNAIVVKPSPLAPFGVEMLLNAMARTLPEGLLAVTQGDVETATALVSHPQIARVAFTGGDGAGRAIAALAGSELTPSVLELGGNDAAILLPDVDLDPAAAERLVMAAFATSGQVCMAVKRLFVHRSRLDEVVAELVAAAERVLCLGDPMHAGSTMGPVVSATARDRLERLLDAARSSGGTVLDIGRLDSDTDLTHGHYVRPALVLGLSDEHPLVADEQFGPLLPVLAFDTVEEVVARANATDLGLAASVWSQNEEQAFAVADRLDAGFTFINTHNRTGMTLRAPFGGVKNSGWGREYGDEGLAEYAQPCVTHLPAAFRVGGSGSAANAYPVG